MIRAAEPRCWLAGAAAVVMSSPSGGRRFRALAGELRACATAGTPRVQQQPARSITEPDAQARALASVASAAEPAQARSCIAGALAIGRWVIPLKELARVDPAALAAFADERAAAGT
jgi:hypothetical protein